MQPELHVLPQDGQGQAIPLSRGVRHAHQQARRGGEVPLFPSDGRAVPASSFARIYPDGPQKGLRAGAYHERHLVAQIV